MEIQRSNNIQMAFIAQNAQQVLSNQEFLVKQIQEILEMADKVSDNKCNHFANDDEDAEEIDWKEHFEVFESSHSKREKKMSFKKEKKQSFHKLHGLSHTQELSKKQQRELDRMKKSTHLKESQKKKILTEKRIQRERQQKMEISEEPAKTEREEMLEELEILEEEYQKILEEDYDDYERYLYVTSPATTPTTEEKEEESDEETGYDREIQERKMYWFNRKMNKSKRSNTI